MSVFLFSMFSMFLMFICTATNLSSCAMLCGLCSIVRAIAAQCVNSYETAQINCNLHRPLCVVFVSAFENVFHAIVLMQFLFI